MDSASVRRHTPSEQDDASLVRSVLAGDSMAFAAIYDRYADELFAFSVTMLGDRENAADVVQDVFVTAAERLSQLRDPSKLRAWLYAIARHEIFRRWRSGDRERPVEQLPDQPAGETDEPATHAARTELSDLVWAACRGLSDRDQAVLELHLRHGLTGQELGDALGVSAAHAHVMFQRARDGLNRSLGVLLLARHGAQGCPQLAKLLEHWDGQLTPLIRKRIARHTDQCSTCGEQRRRRVNPAALLSSVAILPAPDWLRPQTLSSIDLASMSRPLVGGDTDVSWWPPPVTGRRRTRRDGGRHSGEARRALAGAVFLTLLIAALTLTYPAAPPHPAPTAVPAADVPLTELNGPAPTSPPSPPQPTTTDAPLGEPRESAAARPHPLVPEPRATGHARGSASDVSGRSRRARGDGDNPPGAAPKHSGDEGTFHDGRADRPHPSQEAAESPPGRYLLPRSSPTPESGQGPPSSTESNNKDGKLVE
jgi:RNA polymerase sigma factor (sigma-70 family)